MTESFGEVLSEIERFGTENDGATQDRSRRMLNVTRDTGEFLSVVVRATGAQRILEIGTSNGYSTLWLASAARATGGLVTTLELSEYKVGLARKNFSRAGLGPQITLVLDETARVLERAADASFDLIFLDAERREYPALWEALKRVLRPGGLIVVDNAISHPDEMAPFVALVRADGDFTTSLVPVGKGEFLAVKSAR